MKFEHDAVVVGSGPNGLSAAIVLARAGLDVLVLEGSDHFGGGVHSASLMGSDAVQDVCASVFPLGIASPFFDSLPLARHGLRWLEPPAPLAHPLDGGTAVTLEHSLPATASGLGADERVWLRVFGPLIARRDRLLADILAPLHLPAHAPALARFGWNGMRSARSFATRFRTREARALFAGLAMHGNQPFERPLTAAFGLLFGMLGSSSGWPIARGGAQRLSDALVSHFRELGGQAEAGRWIDSLAEIPKARAVLLDVTPRQFGRLAENRLPPQYARKLAAYRYGSGVFKMDWLLNGPIPWTAPQCARAATVHLGGTFQEIADAEAAVGRGEIPERPPLILVQPTLFDPGRGPAGIHSAWAYCHVPNGSASDMRERIERQIERFAPGFRGSILKSHVFSPAGLEAHNPNCVGGDIAAGAMDVGQLFARPFLQWNSYATPLEHVYLCSASTPPGGGVHGMCGFHAARTVLKREFGYASNKPA